MERSKLAVSLLVLASSMLSGCAMCSSPFDECYAAFGGSCPRADMLAGRVGSIDADAGMHSPVTGISTDEHVESQFAVEPIPVEASQGETFYDEYFDNEQFDDGQLDQLQNGSERVFENVRETLRDAAADDALTPIESSAPELPFNPLSTDENPLR